MEGAGRKSQAWRSDCRLDGRTRNLAKLYESQGNSDAAIPHLKQSLDIARQRLDQLAAIQSERQQLAMAGMFRSTLDSWLSLATRAEIPVEEVYAHVFRWKGAVFARQLEQRNLRRVLAESDDPELVGMVAELDSTSCRIAALVLSVPAAGEEESRWQRLGELTRRKEELEATLSAKSATFRDQQAAGEVTIDKVKELLPDNLVLVDVLEYTQSRPSEDGTGKWKSDQHMMAFIICKDRPIERVGLGYVAQLAQAIALWRGTINRKNPIVNDNDPVLKVQAQFWKPIEEHLKDDDQVLVSPDGALRTTRQTLRPCCFRRCPYSGDWR